MPSGVYPHRSRTLAERFWSKVDKSGECWRWLANRAPAGYGRVGAGGIDGPTLYAHRVAYELLVGSIPDGKQLDHLCRNRWCVNPSHLEPVTNRENGLRGESIFAQHARQTHCKHGHVFDEANTYRRPDNGGRQCKACRHARQVKTYVEVKAA